jgi:hypothetical protein
MIYNNREEIKTIGAKFDGSQKRAIIARHSMHVQGSRSINTILNSNKQHMRNEK